MTRLIQGHKELVQRVSATNELTFSFKEMAFSKIIVQDSR